MLIGKKIAGLFSVVVLSVLVAAPAGAAPSDSREDYVAVLDPICKRDAQRNSKLLRGTERLVRQNRLKQPSRRFARAANNFQRTLNRIGRIEPPAADKTKVDRWLKQLKVQVRYLRQMSKVLARGQRGKALQLKMKLLRNTNQANNTVFLFNFKHCVINPTMYG